MKKRKLNSKNPKYMDKSQLTEKEVLKLSDPFLEAQYLPKVKNGNPLAPSKDFQALAKNQFKGYATKHAKQGGVAVGRESTQWNNIIENAEREYPDTCHCGLFLIVYVFFQKTLRGSILN